MHALWPTYATDSQKTAEIEWFRLNEAEREQAAKSIGPFIHHAKNQNGRTVFCSFSVYLNEKRWLRLPVAGSSDVREKAAPFGKMWGAIRLVDLMRQPYGYMPPPTGFLKQLIEKGGPAAERETLQRQARYGWPKVNDLQERAIRKRAGTSGEPALEPLADLFGKVHRSSSTWIAWRDLHEKKGWPWFGPDRDCPDWVWMPEPPDDHDYPSEFHAVRAALARFEEVHSNITTKEAAE